MQTIPNLAPGRIKKLPFISQSIGIDRSVPIIASVGFGHLVSENLALKSQECIHLDPSGA